MRVGVALDQATPGVRGTFRSPRGNPVGGLFPPGQSLSAEVVLNDVDPALFDHVEIGGRGRTGFSISDKRVITVFDDESF